MNDPFRENEFMPGKLWSLWELMPRLRSETIYSTFAMVAKMDQKWRMERAGRQPIEAHQYAFFARRISEMASALFDAGLPMSAKHARGLLEAVEQATGEINGDRVFEGMSRSLAEHHMDRLISILPEESEIRIFLSLDPVTEHLYAPTETPFGDDVERVFPVAIDDIRAAGKCLALGMGTATVFHLMRVMEAGYKAVAEELGVPYAPSWEAYERKLKSILDPSNYPNLTDDQRTKRPFYDAVLGDLNSVKMVWRNPTMHIVKSYDVEQARLIYAAVASFMRHLADRLEPIGPVVISTGQSQP